MRMHLWAVCGAILLLIVGGAAPSQMRPDGTPLSGAELQAKFEHGALLDLTRADGNSLSSVVLLPGGRALLQYFARNGNAGQDKGKWYIEGSALCFEWSMAFGGAKRCGEHFTARDGRHTIWSLNDQRVTMTYTARLFP